MIIPDPRHLLSSTPNEKVLIAALLALCLMVTCPAVDYGESVPPEPDPSRTEAIPSILPEGRSIVIPAASVVGRMARPGSAQWLPPVAPRERELPTTQSVTVGEDGALPAQSNALVWLVLFTLGAAALAAARHWYQHPPRTLRSRRQAAVGGLRR